MSDDTLAQERREKFLDFEIEKTHSTFFESGKVGGSAFLVYLLLLCLTLIILFGNAIITSATPNDNQVKIPFLDLTVNKPYASWILLILCDLSLYWFVSALNNEMLMARKLYVLLDARYKTGWYTNLHLRYPSMLSLTFLNTQYASGKFRNSINYTLLISSIAFFTLLHLSLTGVVSYKISFIIGWNIPWVILFSLNLIALVPAAFAVLSGYNLSQLTNEEAIERMILPEPDYAWDKKAEMKNNQSKSDVI